MCSLFSCLTARVGMEFSIWREEQFVPAVLKSFHVYLVQKVLAKQNFLAIAAEGFFLFLMIVHKIVCFIVNEISPLPDPKFGSVPFLRSTSPQRYIRTLKSKVLFLNDSILMENSHRVSWMIRTNPRD